MDERERLTAASRALLRRPHRAWPKGDEEWTQTLAIIEAEARSGVSPSTGEDRTLRLVRDYLASGSGVVNVIAYIDGVLAGVSPSTGEDRLREAILVDRDGEACECDWMHPDVEPLQDCPGCDRQVRLYRDNVIHHNGRHYHRGHVAFAALTPTGDTSKEPR